MSTTITLDPVDRLTPIDLDELDRTARLRTRKDRKYVLDRDAVTSLLATLDDDARALEIDGRRWFAYRSVYFDTPQLDAYRLAATRRPRRFKVRHRTYLDAGLAMAEVKTKSRRGKTVKRRLELAGSDDGAVRAFAARFDEVAPYADDLEPVLVSEYERSTIVLPTDGVRITIDVRYRCTDRSGSSTGLGDEVIVETKTGGPPSVVDRRLWAAGHRPVKISKFATGLAALDPTLGANRWHRVLREHFDRPSTPIASNRSIRLGGAAA